MLFVYTKQSQEIVFELMRLMVFTLLLSYFQVSAQSTDIIYEIKNASDSFYILGHHMDDQRVIFDTLRNTSNGVLHIKYEESTAPGLYFIYGPYGQFYQEFIINENTFQITTDGTYEGTTVTDSKENDVFVRFQKSSLTIQKQVSEYNQLLQKSSEYDSLKIIDRVSKLELELKDLRNRLAAEKPELLVSKILALLNPVELNKEDYSNLDEVQKQQQQYIDYRRKFKKRLDFNEEGLLRTPVFKRNVMRYVTEVIPQVPDSIIHELNAILYAIESDSLIFRYWLSTFTTHYEKSKIMGMQAVLVHLLDSYYLTDKVDWISEETRVKIEQEVALMKPNQVGKPAPPLVLVDSAMETQQPLKISNDYLVLYFYDPDCGVCKKKTPILKENYLELKKLDVEVVAINIASEINKWKNYIKENRLEWVNLADPAYKSTFRERYNIKSTPFLYVLDQNRKIIARKLGVEQVVDFITNYRKLMGQDSY